MDASGRNYELAQSESTVSFNTGYYVHGRMIVHKNVNR